MPLPGAFLFSLSGVAGYQYSLNGSTWSGTVASGTNYTLSGIKANTTVTIYARTVDNVGWISSNATQTAKTSTVSTNVSLSRSTSNWTNGNVTVNLSHGSIPSGYVIQYSTNGTNWTTGTSVIVTTNNTIVYGRLYNSVLSDGIAVNSVTIGNIDKVNPLTTAPTATSTTSTITVTFRQTDAASGIPNDASHKWYRITNSSGTSGSWVANGAGAHTFTGLSQNTQYYVQTRAMDAAGNEVSSGVTAIKTKVQLVTGISLNKTSITLKKGATDRLVATISPSNANNKGVTWTSSNTGVATVDTNGNVTAKGVGNATITATAKDGSGKSATCIVMVKSSVSNVEIVFNISFYIGNDKVGSGKLICDVSLNGDSKTIRWNFDTWDLISTFPFPRGAWKKSIVAKYDSITGRVLSGDRRMDWRS